MIVFDIITDMLSNKNLTQCQLKYFLEAENKTFLLFLLSKLILLHQKNIKLKSKHYFIMKILNKRQFQQIAFNHSPGIRYEIPYMQNHILFS